MVSQSYENKFGIKLSDDQRISNLDSNGLIKTEELVQKIPLYNEKLDVTKKSENGNLKIEKKWITVKKEIEIPLKYEEIFINDKVFDSYSDKEKGEIFFQIKSKISDAFLRERTDEKDNKQLEPTGSEVEIVCWEPEGIELNKNVISEKAISLSYVTMADQTDIQQPTKPISNRPTKPISNRPTKQISNRPTKQISNRPTKQISNRPTKQISNQPTKQISNRPTKQISNSRPSQYPTGRPNRYPTGRPNQYPTADQTGIQQPTKQIPNRYPTADQANTQETFELWGEEIIIDKKMVKLAEIVIKKYQVNEKRKIDVEVNREKLTLKFPGNFKEEIS